MFALKANTKNLELSPEPQTAIKLKDWIIGISGYSIFAWIYDYPLYVLVIGYFGVLWGGVIMTLLTIPVDLISIRLYDWSKRDWLALEFIKSHKQYQGKNPIRRFLKYILSHTPVWLQAVFLSLKFNAFIITALLREDKSTFNGLTRRDWCIFIFSFITSQIYWILFVGLGIEAFRWLIFWPQ